MPVIDKAMPSPAYLNTLGHDPYGIAEQSDNRHNGGKSVGGRFGSALGVGFAMMNDDMNSDVNSNY